MACVTRARTQSLERVHATASRASPGSVADAVGAGEGKSEVGGGSGSGGSGGNEDSELMSRGGGPDGAGGEMSVEDAGRSVCRRVLRR